MLIAVGGGVSKSKTKSVIQSYFSDIKRGEESSFEIFEAKNLKPKINLISKPVEQSHVVLGGIGIERFSEKRFALEVGKVILGKGFGSLLFQSIREKYGLAYYIRASHSGYAETGAWDVSMGVDTKRLDLAIEAVLKELASFRRGDFEDEDLDRAKNYILGNLVTELESSDDIALWHGLQQLLNDEVLSPEEAMEKYRKVTKDQVLEIWSRLLRKDNILMSIITPVEDEKRLKNNFQVNVEQYL